MKDEEISKLLGRGSFERRFKFVPKGYKNSLILSKKQFEATFQVEFSPYQRFKNLDVLTEVISNCPWILRTFAGNENRALAEKYKTELGEADVADVIIKWVNPNMGYGLFAGKDFVAGEWIGEYTGDVHRLYRWKGEGNPYCFHYPTRWWSLKYFVIDSLSIGNEMRFINHSLEPNLEPICLLDRNLLHMAFLTKRPIEKGEQLFFNYHQKGG